MINSFPNVAYFFFTKQVKIQILTLLNTIFEVNRNKKFIISVFELGFV
jgi:hypothetical protein